MKTIAVVGTVAAVAALAALSTSGLEAPSTRRFLQGAPVISEVEQHAFQKFIQSYNKNYLTSQEFAARLQVFAKNLAFIAAHNPSKEGYTLDINQFADLTLEEFERMQGFKPQETEEQATIIPEGGRHLQSNPDSLDWRTKGALNPVRNQGGCGGCYTFSSVASLEAQYFLQKGSLPQLSEQQLLDCTSTYGNQGCFGGLMTNSFNYLKKYKSMTRVSYPYTGSASTCKYNAASGVISTTGYVNVAKNDPSAHLDALQNGPVSIAIAASSSAIQFYKSGVITSSGCGISVNHAVNMVGYGTDSATGNDYWLIRNSWGSNWGEQGYFRVLRTTATGPGVCGILQMSSQPTI